MPRSRSRRQPTSPAKLFRQAIDDAKHLNWQSGVSAIPRAEGRNRVSAIDTNELLGSANIDRDCSTAGEYQSDNRWDFVVGYRRKSDAIAFFVEVHSARSSEVSCMEKKWKWLRRFLQEDGNEDLRKLPAESWWVASGKVNIPKHVPQYKRLARLNASGLSGPTKNLVLS